MKVCTSRMGHVVYVLCIKKGNSLCFKNFLFCYFFEEVQNKMKIFISVKNPNLLQKRGEETQHSFPRSKEKKIERLCGKKTVIKHVEHLAVSKPISL